MKGKFNMNNKLKNRIFAILCAVITFGNFTVSAEENTQPTQEIKENISEDDNKVGTIVDAEEDSKYTFGEECILSEEIEQIQDKSVSESVDSTRAISAQSTSEEDLRNRLGGIIDRIMASDYEDVAENDSISAVKQALSSAVDVYENTEASEAELNNEINELSKAIEEIEYVSKQYILSDNNMSDEDMSGYYPDVLIENTNVSYTYDENSPENLQKNDKTNTALNDGKFAYKLTGKTDDDTVAVFDMGEDYYINGVDVFSQFLYFSSTRMNIGGFKVEVSRNGSDYTEVATVEAKTDPEEGETGTLNYVLKTESKFPVYLGRYVRITVKKDTKSANGQGSAQYNLAEIVIQGFKNPYSKDDLFEALREYSDVDRAIYTAGTYAEYAEAYKAAEAIYWDESINGKEIYTAKVDLQNAYNSLENCAEIKILSGNVTSAADRELYKDFDTDTLNLSYSYAEGTPSQFITQDSDCTRLLSGNCSSTDGSRIVYGNWGTTSPAKVLFDLGEECYISGVDIWEYALNSGCRIGKAEILASSDGTNFESVSQTEVPEGLLNSINVIEQNFDAKKCRYLMVSATTVRNQVILGEIVIRGYRTGSTEKEPYKLGILDYKNDKNARLISLDGENTVNVSGQISSKSNEDKQVVILSAAYSGNKMIDWSFTEVNLKAYEKTDFTNSVTIDGYADVSIENYVWDSVGNGNALAKIKVFGSL